MPNTQPFDGSDSLYQSVFRRSAVSLWLQDLTKLRTLIAQWRNDGITDPRRHLREHPDALRAAIASIEVVDVNDATLAMYEVTDKAELLGPLDRTLDFDDPTTVENLTEDVLAVWEGRTYLERQSSAVAPSGRRIEVELRIHLPAKDDEFPYMLVNVLDITALRSTQIALRDSERHYHEIFTNAPFGIFQSTAEGKLLDANQTFAHSMGYEGPEELIKAINSSDISLLYTDPTLRDEIAGPTLTSDEWVTVRGPFNRKDGTTGTGEMKLRSFLPKGSRERRLEGFVEDVTEEERVNAELARERSMFRALMNTTPDRIYFKDREGRFTLVNNAVARFFGVDSPNEVVGKRNIDFFSPAFANQAMEDERAIMSTGEAMIEKEESERTDDGRVFWYRTTKMPLRNERGEIVGIFGISHDVTRRKEMQLQLIQAQRLESLGQLSAGIAHHFNNIQAASMGYLRLALDDPTLAPKTRQYVEEALEVARRSVEITARLGVLSSTAREAPETVDLERLLEELDAEFAPVFQREGITLHREMRGVDPVQVTRSSVDFVLRSILANAIDSLAGRPVREIRIQTRSSGESGSCIEVSDTGCGVREEDAARIFTPFFSTKGVWASSGSPQAARSGLGLSLALCKSLVTEQGGRISIQSKVDEGTMVRVCFPSYEFPPEVKARPRSL